MQRYPRDESGQLDVAEYLDEVRIDAAALSTSPEYRRALCRRDPLIFALVYFNHHLKDRDGVVSFNALHVDMCELALSWSGTLRVPAQHRRVFVAPRECGKTTWIYLIIPMWLAAYGYRSFVSAFANTATQSEQHLRTFRGELDTNTALRLDFPELCTPMRRASGVTVADHNTLLISSTGFAFAVRGIESQVVGLKIGDRRPDMLILDDIEPDAANYSLSMKRKVLNTILTSILPLNIFAIVVLAGTVTMADSIVHEAVKTITKPGEKAADWIADHGFGVNYYAPLIKHEDGTERSMWENKWPTDFLLAIRHTASYLLNYENDPLGAEGDYWSLDDIVVDETAVGPFPLTLLSIDPAVTVKESSDETGLAVVSGQPASSSPTGRRRAIVRHAEGVRLTGQMLRAKVLRVLEQHPDISLIVVETNQGGDLWLQVLHHMPVRIVTKMQSVPKDVRAAFTLNHYQRGDVVHTAHFPQAVTQMVGFPNTLHDDVMDAVNTGVLHLLDAPRKPRASASATATATSYVG